MSDSISIHVSGLRQVEEALDAFQRRKHEDVQAATERAVHNTFVGSQADCPVLSGDLKASGDEQIGDLEGTVSYGNQKVTYPWFVELGTSRQKAQPFLFPHFARNGRIYKDECEQIAKG